ncbi:FtsX-like permease family protein [Nonomuraea sp. NPDC000554]|uniref:FtsX-like permease family protein n=1 Tax=Nonomuraea sp. NPDC000554 TaxID=3154259 RepID=UPI00331C170F
MIRTALAMAGLGGLVVVFCTVLGGTALVTGTGVLAESGLRSHVTADRLAGADVVVTAPQTVPQDEDLPVALPERAVLPATLVSELASLPGVTSATGDLTFPVAVTDPAVVPLGGHGWSSVTLPGAVTISGVPPMRPGEVALSADALPGARLGGDVQLTAGGHPGRYRVTALVGKPGASGSLPPEAYFSDATAATLAGRDAGPRKGTVDLVALRGDGRPEALAQEVRRHLGKRYEVATGDGKGDAEVPGAAASRALLLVIAGSLAGITLLVVGFVVAGALSLSITRQRRDLALLRSAGATPRQVRALVAAQGVVGALLALAPGAALGYLLAGRFGDLLTGLGVLPARLPLTWSPLPAVAAMLLMPAVVRVSAWACSLRVSRMPAVAAVSEAQSEPRTPSPVRARAGLLLIVATVPLSSVPLLVRSDAGAAGTALTGVLAVIGLGLSGPWLVQRGAGLLADRLPDRLPAPAWLAVANAHGHALRTAGAVAALGMVVTLTLGYTLTQTTVMAAAANDLAEGTRADLTLTAPALGGIPRGLLAEVRATPGVAAATATATTTVLIPYREDGRDKIDSSPALVLGPDAEGLVDLGVTKGGLSGLTGATIAVADRSAVVGEERPLILGDGTRVRARVVATYARGLGFGSVVLSRDLAAGHTTSGLDGAVLVRLAGAEPLTAAWPGVEASRDPVGGGAGRVPPEVWVNLALLAVLLGYVLVTVANRLVASTAGRGAELAALRRVGATPGQLRAMLRGEALLVAVAAVAGGVLLSAVPLGLLGLGFLGRPWPAGPGWLLPATALAVGVIAWLAHELPGRRLLRTS